MSKGNGRTAVADEDRERWDRQAESHDDALEQERHLGLVFRELRSVRADIAAMQVQITASLDRVAAIVDGMNAVLTSFMKATNDHEKRLASLEADRNEP